MSVIQPIKTLVHISAGECFTFRAAENRESTFSEGKNFGRLNYELSHASYASKGLNFKTVESLQNENPLNSLKLIRSFETAVTR